MPIEPDETQIAEVARRTGAEGDGPLVMLNLNRYVPGGHEAYARWRRQPSSAFRPTGKRR